MLLKDYTDTQRFMYILNYFMYSLVICCLKTTQRSKGLCTYLTISCTSSDMLLKDYTDIQRFMYILNYFMYFLSDMLLKDYTDIQRFVYILN